MPNWIQPMLRAKQNAMENEGLLQKRDSVAMTFVKAKEAQGIQAKPSLPGIQHNLRGTSHVANNEL
jgi:hypothetical protein